MRWQWHSLITGVGIGFVVIERLPLSLIGSGLSGWGCRGKALSQMALLQGQAGSVVT